MPLIESALDLEEVVEHLGRMSRLERLSLPDSSLDRLALGLHAYLPRVGGSRRFLRPWLRHVGADPRQSPEQAMITLMRMAGERAPARRLAWLAQTFLSALSDVPRVVCSSDDVPPDRGILW